MRKDMKNRDNNISAMSTPAVGEAGKTGSWRDMKPVINHAKCIPSVKKKSACFLCWLYCPEGVISSTIPVTIDYVYCKGCGVCAEECPAKAITMEHEGDS
jgi:pyruvate ferredoxin oxidoreductase delta subunit